MIRVESNVDEVRAALAGISNRLPTVMRNAINDTAFDALNGVAYGDDRQIVETTARVGEPLPDGGLTVCVEAAI